MFRAANKIVKTAAILCWLISFSDASAARDKEFEAQDKVHLTEWTRLKNQAESGDPNALFILGNYYYQPPKNRGFEKNLKKSAELYFQAGIRGNALAQYNFALMLYQGIGVNKNTLESYVWFKLASSNRKTIAKHINEVSSKIIVELEEKFNRKLLTQANERISFYTQMINEKHYAKVLFPN